MPDYPPIDFDTKWWGSNQVCTQNGYGYRVESLWEYTKDLPVYTVPIISISLDYGLWSHCQSYLDFIYHMKLCKSANLKYPLILDTDGCLMDGRHRLAKAIANGHTEIKIKRIMHMPDPDFTVEDDKLVPIESD